MFDFLLIHTSMVRSFPFFHMIHLIANTYIDILCMCVGSGVGAKIVFGNSLWKSMDSVESHQWPSLTNVFRSESETSTQKNSIVPLSFCRAYSLCYRFKRSENAKKSIVHAKLAESQEKRKKIEGKTDRIKDWQKL